MKLLYTILFFLFLFTPSKAQKIIAEQIPFFYQLPSNEIWDINQDKDGFLWICTTNGLARYDGYELRNFKSDQHNPDLLCDNSTGAISDDGSHIWIATRKGINLYDKKKCTISSFTAGEFFNKHISLLISDSDLNTWIVAEGVLYRYSKSLKQIKEYPLISFEKKKVGNINSLYIDNDSTLWAIASGSGPLRYDKQADNFIAYPLIHETESPFVMYHNNGSDYYIGTWGNGLWHFSSKNIDNPYKKISVKNRRTKKEEPIFFSLTKDDTFGYLWALSYNELYALRIKDNNNVELLEIDHILDPNMMFTRIFKDRTGNLWLSSYDRSYKIFFKPPVTDNYPLSSIKQKLGWDANILNICPDDDNVIWLSQDRYGLCLYDLNTKTISFSNIEDYSGSTEAALMTSSSYSSGVWINPRGTSNLLRLTQKNKKINVEEEIRLRSKIPHIGEISSFVEDRCGNLWIIANQHLFVRPKSDPETINLLDEKIEVNAVTLSDTGDIYIVAEDSFIYKVSLSGKNIVNESIAKFDLLNSKEKISYFKMGYKGTFWLITSLDRIFKSDQEYRFTNLSLLEKEIVDCSVLSLEIYEEIIRIATNKRIVEYNVDTENIKLYNTNDENICVDLFRHKAFHTDSKGGLFAGGHGGFTYFRPDSFMANRNKNSIIVISDIKIDSKTIFFDKNNNSPNSLDKIVIDKSAKNIEINISDLKYNSEGVINYSYILKGKEREWNCNIKNDNKIIYENLSAGRYELYVKTENNKDKSTLPVLLLVIEKEASAFRTIYAYIIYVIIIMIIIYLVCRLFIFKRVPKPLNIENKAFSQDDLNDTSSEDNHFLHLLNRSINNHIDSPDFDIEILCEEMNMSKSTIYRKLKSINGLTPLDYIRRIKLQRACVLLKERELNISQIAYSLGFSNPKYFSKCFKEEFNITPSEYQQKNNL